MGAVATKANTPQLRTCPGCGGPQRLHVNLLKSKHREQWRFLVMGMVELRGTMVRFWRCETPTCMVSEDAGTKWVETPVKESEPVRQHIVFRLKALRQKGWRFFEWQK